MKPNKLLIVRNQEKANQLKEILGSEWKCIGYKSSTTGLSYNQILIVDQPERLENPEEWTKWINQAVRTRLKPTGTLVEVY